jgi:hypothetical protein
MRAGAENRRRTVVLWQAGQVISAGTWCTEGKSWSKSQPQAVQRYS